MFVANIALWRFRVVPDLSKSYEVLKRVEASAQLVRSFISEAENSNTSMYGATTGFGGSGWCFFLELSFTSIQRGLRVG
jgi:histidine ammonia-lyase